MILIDEMKAAILRVKLRYLDVKIQRIRDEEGV